MRPSRHWRPFAISASIASVNPARGSSFSCRIDRTTSYNDSIKRLMRDTFMKSFTKYLTLNVPSKMEFVNITTEVEEAVRTSGVKEGLCLVNSMHITSSVFINDDEHGLHHDFGKWLEK